MLSVLLSILNSEWTNRGGGWCCLSPLPMLSKWFPTSGESHVWPCRSCNQNRLRKKCLMAGDSLRCREPSFHSVSLHLWVRQTSQMSWSNIWGWIQFWEEIFGWNRWGFSPDTVSHFLPEYESIGRRGWIRFSVGPRARDYDRNSISMTSALPPFDTLCSSYDWHVQNVCV